MVGGRGRGSVEDAVALSEEENSLSFVNRDFPLNLSLDIINLNMDIISLNLDVLNLGVLQLNLVAPNLSLGDLINKLWLLTVQKRGQGRM